jgi:two-component system, NtrC family, sensor kinase
MNLLTNTIDALEDRMKVDFSFSSKIYITTEIITSHLSLVYIEGHFKPKKNTKF